MDAVVIGLGSMGKRRIRLLSERNDVEHIYGVDARKDRREEAEAALHIKAYGCLEDVVNEHDNVDCAFVCTSPLTHKNIIKMCLKNQLHVFTEINLLSDGYQENIELAQKNGKKLFLSSTFLYRKEVQCIQDEVRRQKDKVNYIYHVGQYLPEWHPWENYQDFFVGDKRTNGCREIMAIEFPWLIETFGEIREVSVLHDKMGHLNIDYSDNYMIQIEHNNGDKGMLITDVVCPKAVRNLEIYAENLYLVWDGTPSGLKKYDKEKKEFKNIRPYDSINHKEGYQETVIENAYADEIDDFISVILNDQVQRYGFEKDYEVLEWIDRIEGKL